MNETELKEVYDDVKILENGDEFPFKVTINGDMEEGVNFEENLCVFYNTQEMVSLLKA